MTNLICKVSIKFPLMRKSDADIVGKLAYLNYSQKSSKFLLSCLCETRPRSTQKKLDETSRNLLTNHDLDQPKSALVKLYHTDCVTCPAFMSCATVC